MEREYAVNHHHYRRLHERKNASAEIVFYHADRLYTGSLKDVSLGGAYVETPCVGHFSTKDMVTLRISFSSGGDKVKCKGRIQWLHNSGFGIEFI
jgi:hypothetical protein